MDNKNNNNPKNDLYGYAQDAGQTVSKAGQALDKATTNVTASLGAFFERHAELQGWIMIAAAILLILYMLNLMNFMRYIFIALTIYLLVYGVYKSRIVDHGYDLYLRLFGKK